MNARSTLLATAVLLGACGNAPPGPPDAAARADGPVSIIGGSYPGTPDLVTLSQEVRAQGGRVVVARFTAIDGPTRPETFSYGGDIRGERSWAVARYATVETLGEPSDQEVRVDALVIGERVVGPDGYVYRDENNAPYFRDHLMHPTGGKYVLFLTPSPTPGVWWMRWRAALDGSTVLGDYTIPANDGSRRGDVPLSSLSR